MIVSISPSIEQLKYDIIDAYNCFDTLDKETAISQVRAILKGIIKYLDSINCTKNAKVVFDGKRAELQGNLKGFTSNAQVVD